MLDTVQKVNSKVERRVYKLIGSRYRVHACPGLRIAAYASESATGCGYEIVFTVNGLGLL